MTDDAAKDDRFGPLLGMGEDARGKWVAVDGDFQPLDPQPQRVWKGPTRWRTRHGEAVVFWMLGQATRAERVLLPDGSRGEASSVGLAGFVWRVARVDDGYQHGIVDIGEDEVDFIPLARNVAPWLDPEYRPLRDTLLGNPDFADALKRKTFASALYHAIQTDR